MSDDPVVDEGRAIATRIVAEVCDAYEAAAAALEVAGFPPEAVIQGMLGVAAARGVAHGYCLEAMQEYLAGLYASATVGQARCPHCGVDAQTRRS